MMAKSTKRDTPLAERLGSQIKAQRLALGWTQEDLGAKIGVEVNTVSRIECGTHLPSLLRLESIADTLGVSITSLLGAASLNANDQAAQLQVLLNGIGAHERTLILDIAKKQAEFFTSKS